MTAWALNRLHVAGPAPEVVRFARLMPGSPAAWLGSPRGDLTARRPAPQRFCLHASRPVPDAVLRSPDSEAMTRWAERYWGCGHDAEPKALIRRAKGMREVDFETVWAPPLAWLGHVAAEHPALRFRLDWLLPYDVSEYGSATAEDGVLDVGDVWQKDDLEWLEREVFGGLPWGGARGAGTRVAPTRRHRSGDQRRRVRAPEVDPWQLALFAAPGV